MQFDIDATPTRNWDDGKGFTPIGFSSFSDSFGGVFDGGGNVVRGLHIDRPESGGVGLFSTVRGTGANNATSARIANLGVDDARITRRQVQSIGAIIGFAQFADRFGIGVGARARAGRQRCGGRLGRAGELLRAPIVNAQYGFELVCWSSRGR